MMISKPCPDHGHSKIFARALFALMALVLSLSPVFANQILMPEITIPEEIRTGDKVNVQVKLIDYKSKEKIAHEGKFELILSNNSGTQKSILKIKDGEAETELEFDTPGANLITVRDPKQPHVVNYKGFEVGYGESK